MGNEASKGADATAGGQSQSWGACSTLLDDATSLRMLVSCACTAIGDIADLEEHEIPVEHVVASSEPRALLADEIMATNEPMTFAEATGTARLDAARRSRAQEVRESEQNFLREFTTMMRTGLTVIMRYENDELAPVHLMLVPYKQGASAVEWHYRDRDDKPVTGRMLLDDISSVSPNPDPARLGFDLAARSFVVTSGNDGESLLFHADSKDICSLLVDGLQMCIKRKRKRRAAKNRANAKAPVVAPLGDSNVRSDATTVL